MTSPFVRAFTEGNPLYEKYHQVQQPCTPSPALSSFCYYHHQHLQVSPHQQGQQQPSSVFSYSFCNNSNTTPSHHLLMSSSSSVFQNVENATAMSVSPYQHQQNNYNYNTSTHHHQQATLPPHCCCANQEQELEENHDDEDDETSSVLNIVHKNVKKNQYTNAKPYHNSIDLDDKEGEHRGGGCDDLDVDDDGEEDDNITIFTTSVFTTNKLRQNNNNKKSVSFSKHHHQEFLEDDFDHHEEQDQEEVENEDDAEYWQNNEEYQYPTYRDDQIPHELDHNNHHDHHHHQQNFVASSLPQHPFAHFGTPSPFSSSNHQPAVVSPSTATPSIRCHNPYAHMKKEEQHDENPHDDHTTMRIHDLLSSGELNVPFLPSCTPLQFDSLRNFVLQHQPAKALSNLDSTESSYVRLFVGRVNKSITGNQLRLLFWLFAGVSIQGFEIAQQDVKPFNNSKKCNKTTNKNHHHQHHNKTSSSSREDADAAYVWVHPYDVARCLRLLHKKVLIDQNGFFYAETKREVAILHMYGSALGRNLHHHQAFSSSHEQNSLLLNSYLRKAIIFCRPRQTITVTVSRDGEDKKYFEDYISPLCSCEFCHNFYENNDNDGQNEEFNSYQIEMEEFHKKLLSFYNQQQQQNNNIENVKVLRFPSIKTIIDSHSNINGNSEKLSEKMLQYSRENTQLYFRESNLLSEENIQQLQHRQGNSSSSSFPCSWIECKYSHHNSNNFVRPPLPSL